MTTSKKLLEELVDKAASKPSRATAGELKTASKKGMASDRAISPMDALLEQRPLHIPEVGDVLPGVVIDIAAHSILLDLGAFGTGIVLGKEMKDGLLTSKVKVGDAVTATLIDLENEDGHVELSIREASYDKAWEDIEVKRTNKDVVTTKVLEANKGGLMVEINGITGFLPVSQLASEHYPRVEDGDKNKILELLKRIIGQELSVRILDADRVAEKLIVSEKAAQSERDRALIGQLAVGDIIEGDVSGVVDFGAFVKFEPRGARKGQKLEGLVHISELAWQLIDNPREIVKTGDHVRAKVIGVEDTRISLSIKVLKEDPWATVKDRYHVGDVVTGKVDKINHFGAFVYLDQDIHGLAHVSEFHEIFPKKKMEELFTVGQEYQWKILSIEPRTHRMGLLPVK